jgi:hypothetical protein
MARPSKKGLDYFPFDVDFFDDIKVRKLIKRQGGKAVAVYALLLCFIYKNGYYIGGDEELPFIISEKTGYDEVYIQEVIKSCISLGLFDKSLYEKGIITSLGIQIRYLEVQKWNKRLGVISVYNLISSEFSTQRKENKIKEKEIPPLPPEVGKVSVSENSKKFMAFQEWILKDAPNVARMTEPFTEDQYVKIREKYPLDFVKRLITEMHNWKDLKKKNISAYLTFINWANRRKNG